MELFSVQSFFLGFFRVLLDSSFLWLPAILGYLLWKLWLYYIRLKFLGEMEWAMLEIKFPREIPKSPRAMEMILNVLHLQRRDGNFVDKYWKGVLRPWFSLEVASFGGQIHFYLYIPKGIKKLVESQIYAQYPDIELEQVDDYTLAVARGDKENLKFYAGEYILEKEDAYPIRTYIDYGLDNLAAEEEQKTDPMTSLLELMGSLKAGEQIWFQILIRSTKTKWKDAGAKLVEKMMKRDQKEEDSFSSLMLSPGERIVLEAIERNVSKLGFDTCVRVAYLAEKDLFNRAMPHVITGAMTQYNAHNLNGFKRINATAYVNYLLRESRESARERRMFAAYCQRAAFYIPVSYSRKTYVLNTEELATIYHFPGRVAETPTLARIEAKKSEPPANLPM
ncbi:MAG: hypothetical protein L6Q29_04465 [Candidatus Pacebacteria bacterium]|nr:hypothetical protein [Candidatus Paceibacterota bacterium]